MSSSRNNNNTTRSFRGGGGDGRPPHHQQRKFKPPAPKHEENREAWERLKERYESAHSENYERTLARAIKSLAASKEPITTYQQAMALPNVGQHCASIICPIGGGPASSTTTTMMNGSGAEAPTRAVRKPKAKKKKATGEATNATATSICNETEDAASSSVKEDAYEKAKQEAIAKWSHPIRNTITTSTSTTSTKDGLVWKVLLLVDNREQKCEHILSKCSMSGIPAEERVLPIGDMTWIAQGLRKERVNGKVQTTVQVELLLGTIIERKTTEDLVSSLFGTRYMEQRLRLQHSGLPQVLFLIEGDIQKDVHPSFPKERLQMALMETRIYLGFQMVRFDYCTKRNSMFSYCLAVMIVVCYPQPNSILL